MKPARRAFVAAFALGAALAVSAASGAQTRTKLVVYSTLVPEHVDAFRQAFEAAHPEIELVIQRESTGTLTARILAERNNPRADFVWGLAITSMMLLDRERLLLPHAPPELAAIKPGFRDPKDPPAWVGMDAWAAAVCFNTVEAAKRSLPTPRRWTDLLDPRFKGLVVMPNPASSGTGFFHVSAWLQMWGEEKAWAFMDALDRNISAYAHSGTKPCADAARGDVPVAIGYDLQGADLKTKGAPIDVLVMAEGSGWEVDAAAILASTRHPDAAKKLMDWAASRAANEIYARYTTIVAYRGIEPKLPNRPAGLDASLIRNDFAWASANRERIIKEWQRRYEGTRPK